MLAARKRQSEFVTKDRQRSSISCSGGEMMPVHAQLRTVNDPRKTVHACHLSVQVALKTKNHMTESKRYRAWGKRLEIVKGMMKWSKVVCASCAINELHFIFRCDQKSSKDRSGFYTEKQGSSRCQSVLSLSPFQKFSYSPECHSAIIHQSKSKNNK